MIALIDADSLIYIIAWHHKDLDSIAEGVVRKACDNLVQAILNSTKADTYIGSFSNSSNFRNEYYKYAPYKGNRKDKDEWVLKWESVIKTHLIDKWGFIEPTHTVEADDIICSLWYNLNDWENIVICSTDKDLRQIPGYHLNYRKVEDGILYVEEHTALYNFWKQMLIGDATDNIKGIPGLGEVKVDKLFKELTDQHPLTYLQCVQNQYLKYFGNYYGDLIYRETLIAVQLLQPQHPLWSQSYSEYINHLKENYVRQTPTDDKGLDGTMLKELGW